MIWRTIGAATVPPSPSEFTTITATAIFGSFAGAKAVNQASSLLRRGLARAELLTGFERRRAELRGPGLAGDLDPRQRRGGPGAAADHADHQVLDRRRGLR